MTACLKVRFAQIFQKIYYAKSYGKQKKRTHKPK